MFNVCLFSTDLIGCRPKSGKYINYEDTNHVRFLSKHERTVNQGLLLEKHSSLEVSTTAGTTQTREGMGWTDVERYVKVAAFDTSWDSEILRACLGNPKWSSAFFLINHDNCGKLLWYSFMMWYVVSSLYYYPVWNSHSVEHGWSSSDAYFLQWVA